MPNVFQTFKVVKDKDGKIKKDKSGKLVKGDPHTRWRFHYNDWKGNRCTATGYSSKSQTEKLVARVQAYHDEIRMGIRPAPTIADKNADRPFDDVVAEYLAWGNAQGGLKGRPWGKVHSRKQSSTLAWWIMQLDLKALCDIYNTLPQVEEKLRELLGKKLSGKTIAKYSGTLRAFCSWCLKRKYISEDPLASLEPINAESINVRRAMTLDEIRALISAAPPHRQILYSIALTTGLRASELRSLSTDDLDVKYNALRLHSEWTKNRRAGYQPLPAALVNALQAFINSGMALDLYQRHSLRDDAKHERPANPLLFVSNHPCRDINLDMKEAGIAKKTAEGKLDFHALRVSYVTMALEFGATVKEAQTLARHSTPELTMNIYGRSRQERLVEVTQCIGNAVLKLPESTVEVQCESVGVISDEEDTLSGKWGERSIPPASTIFKRHLFTPLSKH